MKWQVVLSLEAKKQLRKMGQSAKTQIAHYLKMRIETAEDPSRFGKPLLGDLAGLWRYRVGDYRLLCKIQNHELTVLVVKVGHRRDVYE